MCTVQCSAGIVDSTLLEASDILPTVADLAGLVPAAAAAAAAAAAGNNSDAANARTSNAAKARTAAAARAAAAAAAQLIEHKPWDGISFKNLLLTDTVSNDVTNSSSSSSSSGSSGGGRCSSSSSSSYRGTCLATQQQLDRYAFSLSAHCWSPDAVPRLDKNRWVGVV
jgi:ElaB/YqjD/DUF883 family membrane-anchored ribosome-binding protein